MKVCSNCSGQYEYKNRGSKGLCNKCYHKLIYYPKNYKSIISKAIKWNKLNPERRREISRNSTRKIRNVDINNLPNSNTHRGRAWELYALNLLKGAKDINGIYGFRQHHDLEWRGKKIDVKSNNYRSFWSFVKGVKNDADFYLCFCLKNNELIKTYLFPASIFNKGLSVGNKSKHDKYLFKLN